MIASLFIIFFGQSATPVPPAFAGRRRYVANGNPDTYASQAG